MKNTYLEVTFRGGKVLAAYYYLPRRLNDRSVRVENHGPGLLVDLTADNRPIGIEIAIPEAVSVQAVNEILKHYGLEPIDDHELAPLRHAARC
jgi:hypothetical protein